MRERGPADFPKYVKVVQGGKRDARAAAKAAPSDSYALVFCEADDPGQAASFSRRRNPSKFYFINGEVMTLRQVEALPGDHSTLLGNMRRNRYSHVVRVRAGGFVEFDPKKHDVVKI